MDVVDRRQKGIYIPFLLLALSFVLIFLVNHEKWSSSSGLQNKNSISPKEGFFAPDFSLPDLNGRQVSLSEYKGNIVFLNFWATWCPTCEDEMPSMEKLYQQFKDKGLVMLTISRDKGGKGVIEPYMKKLRLTFPVLLDPDNKIGTIYQTTGVPETFIIDRDGIIRHKAIGPRNWADKTTIKAFESIVIG